MLIKTATLKQIKSGDVKVMFRRWKKPTVKSGGTLNTVIGQLAIQSVDRIAVAKITKADALGAGFESKKALLQELQKREGDVYRIELSYAGADPRIKLRENDRLSKTELAEILEKLARFDARSQHGDWTYKVMSTINKHPETLAANLAAKLGYEKAWFKSNVRKLKNIGLTVSHGIGYSLSPRGVRVFKQLKRNQ